MLGACLVVLGTRHALTVKWTCSTENSTWQKLPVAHTLNDDICTPMPNVDCMGNDIARHQNISDAAGCCDQCKATPSCEAWTFDTTSVHVPFCFVKTRCSNSSAKQGWTVVSGRGLTPPPAPLKVSVNTTATLHKIEGFGGCFNEKGWDALTALSEDDQSKVMHNLFSPDGLNWTINRMPIGSSDFADSYYSLDDTVGDLAMKNITLERDQKKLIPYVKAAMAVQPGLRVWGSPWTAPEWLKDSAPQKNHNEGCGSLSPEPAKRAAYALYLARAAKAFRAAGLNFEQLAIQNEPNQGDTWNGKSCRNSYPKMHWSGEQLRSFLREHIGPTFASEGIDKDVGIFLATFPVNSYSDYVAPTLNDPEAAKYLQGVGLQYAGVGMMEAIRQRQPQLKLWETETPCGGGRAHSCGSGPGTQNNSWAWGEGQWRTTRSFLESGASVYSQWNMILDQSGKSGWGWSQCSPVTIDTEAKTVTYEGSYWATKHFSFFIEAGAEVLTTAGGGACASVNGACGCPGGCDHSSEESEKGPGEGAGGGEDSAEFVSFKNPNGDVIVVALNLGDAPRLVQISLDGELAVHETLLAHSMSTFVISK